MNKSAKFGQIPPRHQPHHNVTRKGDSDEISGAEGPRDEAPKLHKNIKQNDGKGQEKGIKSNFHGDGDQQFKECTGSRTQGPCCVHVFSFLLSAGFNEVFLRFYQSDNLDFFHTNFLAATLIIFCVIGSDNIKAISTFSFAVPSLLLLLLLVVPHEAALYSQPQDIQVFATLLTHSVLSLAAFAQAFLCLCALYAFCEWVSRPVNVFLERRPDMKKPVAFALFAVLVIVSLLFVFKEFYR